MTDKLVVVCPECGTRTTVGFDDSSDVVETHNEKRHGGDFVAGVELTDDVGRSFIAPTPDMVREELSGLETPEVGKLPDVGEGAGRYE